MTLFETRAIDHSENKLITLSGLFESKLGPGKLQSSVQQTRPVQECQRQKVLVSDYVSTL